MSARFVLTVLLALAASWFAASPARAEIKTYHVVKCHPWHYAADEVQQAGGHPSYQRVDDCDQQVADYKLGIRNIGGAGNNAYSQFMYAAPPDTTLDGVCLEHRLRRDNHHRAEIVAFPSFDLLETGGDGSSTWSPRECYDLNHQQLIIRLACNQSGGCGDGPNAHAYVRNLDLTFADVRVPMITSFSGDLVSGGGWLRGPKSLVAKAGDLGAGSYIVAGYVNGTEIGRIVGNCGSGGLGWPYAVKLTPCPGGSEPLSIARDTALPPFVNGPNQVTAYTADFAGNPTTQSTIVLVDNAAPSLGFANAQDPDDPDLIRAPVSDVHSGVESAQILYRRVGGVSWLPLDTRVESGEARARIETSELPSGDYEFKAEAADVAGNATETTLRQNGTPMRLTFPLRFESELRASLGEGGAREQTVSYGTPSRVRGRLVDTGGDPLVNKEVLVTENFGDGALIRERPTTLLTDAQGRFETRIPAGPSRTVEVGFAGTQKYLPAAEEVGTLNVKSKASFRPSRKVIDEGEQIGFKGRVRHFGARIPDGGKLVELQVRVRSGRWDTVKEAFRTRPSGRYSLSYRFGKHYASDALFRFRVKIQDEGDWPFERATTHQRRVLVRAR